ncbi:MAG: hypothetical protein JOY59_07830, partial [Candidatus Eremiobacteraeota bacterium]|nr:hypothetical protein [Candidatus Eremiobacteraeota bacterium]
MLRHLLTPPVVLAVALALSGCGGGGSGAAAPPPASNASSTSLMTSDQQSNLVSTTTNAVADSVETGLGGSVQPTERGSEALNPCITPSPKPPVINSDGIPANETYTYNNCTNLGWASDETVNGQINITDTTPASGSPLSYTQTDTNLSESGTDANGNAYSDVLNGQRFPSLASNVLSVRRAMQVARTTSAGTANVGQNWNWSFTPNAGSTITLLKPLPAGQFNSATGTITWARGTENFTVNFSIT